MSVSELTEGRRTTPYSSRMGSPHVGRSFRATTAGHGEFGAATMYRQPAGPNSRADQPRHQELSLSLIRDCLSSVDSLYASIQGFNPGATATAAARRAKGVRIAGFVCVVLLP